MKYSIKALSLTTLTLSTALFFSLTDSSQAVTRRIVPLTTASLVCTANLLPPAGPLSVRYQPSLNGINLGNGSTWNPFTNITPADFCGLMAKEVCSHIKQNFPAGYHNAIPGSNDPRHVGWVNYPFAIDVNETVSGVSRQFSVICQ